MLISHKHHKCYFREYKWRVLGQSRTHAYEIAQATENFPAFLRRPEKERLLAGICLSDREFSERPRTSRATENFPARLKTARASE